MFVYLPEHVEGAIRALTQSASFEELTARAVVDPATDIAIKVIAGQRLGMATRNTAEESAVQFCLLAVRAEAKESVSFVFPPSTLAQAKEYAALLEAKDLNAVTSNATHVLTVAQASSELFEFLAKRAARTYGKPDPGSPRDPSSN